MVRKATATSTSKTAKVAAPAYRDEVKRLAAYLMKRTNESFSHLFDSVETKPLSEKAQKIQDYIASSMGSYREQTITLFSMLLGEELAIKSSDLDKSKILKGGLVIATGNSNDHNYPLDEILVFSCDGSASGLLCPKNNWRGGNNISTVKSDLRLPTEVEVLEYVNTNYDTLVSKLGVVIL